MEKQRRKNLCGEKTNEENEKKSELTGLTRQT